MSLEHYKTQVLLLHSQQSTLDTLSAGFNDRYSVHCATSGTEALNTLGDTPIHVFVSAQDLPGMSGLDAIREAKKRSPDTIGILLAGTDMQDGLEALVGIQEVFQIVRGTIEPTALLELIESATKSVRLIALSESANDHKANVDEPVSEHIVMETSENGSAIISDGTGTLPVLRPNKIEMAPGVGGREVDVLVLTKDEEFLATIKDSSRGLHNVYHAVTPTQAEDFVRDNKVGVLVTDAAMVGSNIEGLTKRLRAKRSRIVAIVAGRRDDGELLMDLINRGHVYRFLLKPVSPGRARLAIEASVKHHMEAPDEAFEPKSQPAQIASKPKPAPKRAPAPQAKEKPKPKPVVIQAPAPKPKPAPKPAAKKAPPVIKKPKPKPKPAPVSARKIEPIISDSRIEPTIDSGLDAAFGETGSFTDTMSDIAASVGKSISEAKDSVAGSAMGMLDSVGEMSSPTKNTKVLAIGGGAVAAVAVIAWLVMTGGGTPDEIASEQALDTAPTTNETNADVTAPVTSESTVVETVVPTPPPPYAELLERARAARDAGNLITPAGNSALELYVATVAEAEDDVIVAAEFDNIVGRVLGLAESAILARNAVDAGAALDMARQADPGNPRLTFLGAQLTELQVRDTADQARLAIRDERFEDAGALISEARTIAGASSVEVDLLTEELQSARIRRQVGETLALANEHLDAGTLTSPANDNARYYFQQALVSDPENQAAEQGLITVASKLVLQARDAIDNGQLDRADSLLGDARSLDPTSSELSATTTVLADAREAIAEAARQAEADRLAELERQQEAARVAEAERVAELARQQEADRVAAAERAAELARQQAAAKQAEIDRQAELERLAEEKRLADIRREEERIAALQREAEAAEAARVESEKQANQAATASPLGVGAAAPVRPTPAPSSNRTQTNAATTPAAPNNPQPEVTATNGATTFSLPEAGATGANTVQLQVVQQPEPQQRPLLQNSAPATENVVASSGPIEPEMVSISRLTRTNYVGPEYPRAARRRNITGSVDVQFTVTTDGRVRSMSILRADPNGTFDQAAMDAVEQWRFEPVVENGIAVEKRTAVRLAFDLQ